MSMLNGQMDTCYLLEVDLSKHICFIIKYLKIFIMLVLTHAKTFFS